MKLSEIIRYFEKLFEKKRKNPIELYKDSNLDSSLKPITVNSKNTPIQISEDTVNINGSLTVDGTSVHTDAHGLNDLSDVTYSSGDLTIDSLDKIIGGAGDLTFESTGEMEFKSADGEYEFYDDGTKKLTIDLDASDQIIKNHTADSITLDSVGDIVLDAAQADVHFKDNGVAFGSITMGSSTI